MTIPQSGNHVTVARTLELLQLFRHWIAKYARELSVGHTETLSMRDLRSECRYRGVAMCCSDNLPERVESFALGYGHNNEAR